MNSAIFAAIIVMLLIATAAVTIKVFARLKHSYHAGISLWSRWLPVVATGIYLAVLAVNFATGGAIAGSQLSLNGYFSILEIIVLFLVGPLFLTRMGNLVSTATVAYCVQRLILHTQPSVLPTLSLYLVIGCATMVAVLGDKMPWLAADGINVLAGKLREIMLAAVTIGALVLVFAAIVKVHGFTRWISGTFAVSLGGSLALTILIALFIGWLSVALGFARHFAIALLSLPTLFVLAYVTDWPSHLLIVPFAMSLSLSLAAADRRIEVRRLPSGYSTTVVLEN